VYFYFYRPTGTGIFMCGYVIQPSGYNIDKVELN